VSGGECQEDAPVEVECVEAEDVEDVAEEEAKPETSAYVPYKSYFTGSYLT